MQIDAGQPGPPPTISAVIPAFNAAAVVGRAIESALKQSIPPTEVLVIDDGSTDQTAEVVASYATSVKLLRRPQNGGPGAARNTGIRAASGDWIALLDADDAWLPHKLERQLPWLNNPTVGLVHALSTAYDGRALPVLTFSELWEQNRIIASSAVIRRSALAAVGGFDESPSLIAVEDYNLWLRLALAGWPIATCPDRLVLYTPAPGHLSGRRSEVLAAQLANAALIGEEASLDLAAIGAMRRRILESAARTFLWNRDRPAARQCYRVLLHEQASLAALKGWLATFVPRPILDIRRGLLRSGGPGKPT